MPKVPLHLALLSCVLLLPMGTSAAQETVLPQGEAPPALRAPYFPDRLHEFVWRNWTAVPVGKLARILGAQPEEVEALARSMGLPPPAPVPPEMLKRGYVTLIRRNWHLLPYEQLLDLLEMTPERLAFTLQEDDFLWVKLGRLKPRCEPLRYHPPDPGARRRAAEIRRIVKEEFGTALRRPGESRFAFVRELSTPPPPTPKLPVGPAEPLRLIYSYLAVYGDPLSNPDLDPYPDGFLDRLARVGVNGVWLHAVLRDLAPGGPAFPEFGSGSDHRLERLRALVARAARHGIGVYLYLNEPRAMPEAFYRSRPDLAGVRQGEYQAMCTSQPAVRDWMAGALSHVFAAVPKLAGVYCISASENLTSCASLGAWRECPRCRSRTDTDIIAEVVSTIETGVHHASPAARVIVSDWGWKGHGDARELVARLPKAVWLMSASEWSLPIERGGVRSEVGEYSISSPGPGPRALRHWSTAVDAGVKIAAEIQFNNTCEIASVPYLPVMYLIAEHLANLAPKKLDGMLIGWTMGGHPSPNFELARRMTGTGAHDPEAVLSALASERYGPRGASHAREAWRLFSAGFREYPFHISTVYTSPVQMGPANPLYAAKTGYRATMWGIPYDDIDGWRGPYPAAVLAGQFEKMAERWDRGLAELEAAVRAAPRGRRPAGRADLRYARAAGIQFRSVANQTRFTIAREALAGGAAVAVEERRRLTAEMRRCVEDEIIQARQLFDLVREDSRIGFEPSCHYFYLPLDLVEKVINCRWLLEQIEE
jgi:hypothetical protein